MAATYPLEAQPKRLFTWPRAIVWILLLAGIYSVGRRMFMGLGATTNLTDGFPWGIWVSFNILCFAALAAGGFTMTGLVYLAHYKPYKSVIRPTVVTAFLGYTLLGAGLFFELGRPWLIWHPLVHWNPHSVMFEVAWCVTLYTGVLAVEMSPMVFEKLGWKKPLHLVKSITIPLVVVGVLLSTLHQSSLGTMYLLMKGFIDPLWYTPILPILFYTSAIMIAFAAVICESCISARIFKRSLSKPVLVDLSRFLLVGLIIYQAIRFQDLAKRGVGPLIWEPRFETIAFWFENGAFWIAILILLTHRSRKSVPLILTASILAIVGIVAHRFNVVMISMYRTKGFYWPSYDEVMISTFLAVIAVVGFYLICKYLPVFEPSGAKSNHAETGQ